MIGSESERESWGVRETGKGGRGERIKKFIRGEASAVTTRINFSVKKARKRGGGGYTLYSPPPPYPVHSLLKMSTLY